MRRRPPEVVAVLLTSLWLSLSVGWARSLWADDVLYGNFAGSRHYNIRSSAGELWYVSFPREEYVAPGWRVDSSRRRSRIAESNLVVPSYWTRRGFAVEWGTGTVAGGIVLATPYWAPWLISTPAPLWLLWRWRRRRRAAALGRAGRCVHCGYDLRASGGRCTECGRVRIRTAAGGGVADAALIRRE